MKKNYKDSLPIFIIMIISIALYAVNAGAVVNQYYSAGVYSMGKSFHAFFFNSLDSVGFVTIDKPPLGFWIQTVFTKVFGYSGFVLILPEIICGVLSVYLIYKIIDKRFNRESALISAFILALTPIFTAIARNNTIDSILILCMLLASNQALLAAEKSKIKHLIFAGIFIGIGFNVKMLQAYMIVPAIYILYLIFSKAKFLKRILACGLSVMIMLIVSLLWVTAVDLIDEDKRPYVGSSENNSAIELVVGYNGLNRIVRGGLNTNQTDKMQATQDNTRLNQDDGQDNIIADRDDIQGDGAGDDRPARPDENRPDRQKPDDTSRERPDDTNRQRPQNATSMGSKNGGSGEAGQASVLRLYNTNNAGQISWFILPSLLSVIGLIGLAIKRKLQEKDKAIAFVFFVLCFIPMFIYFSFSSGLAHRYYFATMAPFIAGLVGCGYYYLSKSNRWIMVAVFAVSSAAQIYIQSIYPQWIPILLPICSVVFAATLILMAISKLLKLHSKAVTRFMMVLLILPAIWSATPVIYGDNSQLPITGPELMDQRNAFSKTTDYSEIVSYLEQNRDGSEYLVAVPSSMSIGSQLIMQSDGSVMVLGGFNGSHSTVTLEEFIQMVEENKVGYAIIEKDSKSSANQEIFNWIRNNCEVEKTINDVEIFKLD